MKRAKLQLLERRQPIFIVGMLLVTILALEPCESMSITRFSGKRQSPTRFKLASTEVESEDMSLSCGVIETYEYDGWTLSYRYKPASQGYENDAPLLLIHPVGIGLSSWFWIKFFEKWQGAALYAPDLIGCGVKNGANAFDPDTRGLPFPLGWVQGCEGMMNACTTSSASVFNMLPIPSSVSMLKSRKWNVVCQGGLAPVGVVLAARNTDSVNKLVLTSPPSWNDMTTPIPEEELSFHYGFLRNALVEPIAFGLLETKWAIEFFSNLFLFQRKCDQQWLDFACREIDTKSRPPVQAFNAGFCNHRSFRDELETLPQPTLILSGTDDVRAVERQEYQSTMKYCTLQSMPGKNVLPWESPIETCNAIKDFCY
jgi:pimeloyl-ACP methyl ester carboxylesterase